MKAGTTRFWRSKSSLSLRRSSARADERRRLKELPGRSEQTMLVDPLKRGRTGFDLRFETQAACRG
jgi:hypothetical protein